MSIGSPSSGFVVDCSVCLAWYLEDERSEFTDRVLDFIGEFRTWVPALWRLELTNALLVASRRGRISDSWRSTAIAQAERLPIGFDMHLVALSEITRLAARTNLSVYDAAYLELAIRRRLPLATLDGELVRAARAVGCELLTDPSKLT